MFRKAVDVVLLPSEAVSARAIEANGLLVKRFGGEIVLGEEKTLPHISLAMGCVDEKDVTDIEMVLRQIAEEYSLGDLYITGISVTGNSVGEKVSAFEVEKTGLLQSFHEAVMEKLTPYLSYDVNKDMLYGRADVGESTLLWIKNYREKSSFENFSPHITIGYGEINIQQPRMKFEASRLALCHLGNHCTCQKVLASVEL